MTDNKSRFVWPQNAPFAMCVTHDVDHIRRYLYQSIWRGLREGRRGLACEIRARLTYDNPGWNFERLLKFEDNLGIRSTFFILNETARGFSPKYWGRYRLDRENIKSVLRELDMHGFEIGLHGSLLSYRQAGLLQREKDILEQILGKKVLSTRQHYLNLQEGLTFTLQEACGLMADSSMGSSSHPYDLSYGVLPFFPDGKNIVELPITLMDTAGIENKDVRAGCEKLLQYIKDAGGLITLDWHQCIANDKLFPERMAFLRDAILFAKSNGAYIATMREIAALWKENQTMQG